MEAFVVGKMKVVEYPSVLIWISLVSHPGAHLYKMRSFDPLEPMNICPLASASSVEKTSFAPNGIVKMYVIVSVGAMYFKCSFQFAGACRQLACIPQKPVNLHCLVAHVRRAHCSRKLVATPLLLTKFSHWHYSN